MDYRIEFLRFPGGKAKCLTLSYDDCVEQDQQLCDLMEAYGIAGTFNINSGAYTAEDHTFESGHLHRRMTRQAAAALYSRSPLFEVATPPQLTCGSVLTVKLTASRPVKP